MRSTFGRSLSAFTLLCLVGSVFSTPTPRGGGDNRTEGTIPWTAGNETVETWYYALGDPFSVTAVPLIILHGGPGLASPYMSPHEDLYVPASGTDDPGRPVIFYDQVGCGNSTHLPGRPSSFWSPELFMDELDTVLSYFGLVEEGRQFDVLGNSWGGILGSDWASQPLDSPRRFAINHMRKLVIADSGASFPLWMEGTTQLLENDGAMGARVLELQKENQTSTQEYADLITLENQLHLCTVLPWPEKLNESIADRAEPDVSYIYQFMIGPSGFDVIGSLQNYTIIDRLSNIIVPTLVINGKEDLAQDISVEPFVQGIKTTQRMKFENSSHMPFWEERELYMSVVSKFLDEDE